MTATRRKEISEVKQPEDHKPKVEDVTLEYAGETFTLKAKVLKDYRMVLMLAKADKNAAELPAVMVKLLGEEQHEKMLNALEDEDGMVDIEEVGKFLRELLTAGNRKNS
jgi:hypothetical protein